MRRKHTEGGHTVSVDSLVGYVGLALRADRMEVESCLGVQTAYVGLQLGNRHATALEKSRGHTLVLGP